MKRQLDQEPCLVILIATEGVKEREESVREQQWRSLSYSSWWISTVLQRAAEWICTVNNKTHPVLSALIQNTMTELPHGFIFHLLSGLKMKCVSGGDGASPWTCSILWRLTTNRRSECVEKQRVQMLPHGTRVWLHENDASHVLWPSQIFFFTTPLPLCVFNLVLLQPLRWSDDILPCWSHVWRSVLAAFSQSHDDSLPGHCRHDQINNTRLNMQREREKFTKSTPFPAFEAATCTQQSF